MNTYRIRWEIDIDAESPEAAAKEALEIQRDSDSLATEFEVYETSVDGRPKGKPINVDAANIGETQKPMPTLGSGGKRPTVATKASGLLRAEQAVSVNLQKEPKK